MIRFLVIIVTYNGMKWLDKCLSSVVNSTIQADLFIVDNGSTDGSIEFIKENYPQAYFVESKQNLGFGRANNIGLKYAIDNEYDYMYLLNQDAWVESDTFENLIDIHRNNPEYGIISPLQFNNNHNIDRSFYKYCPIELFVDAINGTLKKIYEVSFTMAAHWLISKKCVLTVGGFSPIFPHYGEDNNYIHRAQYNNYKIGIVPECKAIHDRQYRMLPVNKELHIVEMTLRYILSNPLLTFNSRLKECGKICLESGLRHPFLTVSKALKVMINLGKITKFRKESIKQKAFI